MQAGRRVHHPRRPARRDRGGRRALVFRVTRPARGIDFDIELAKKQSTENPVYYVQYAHARIASILRKAAETGLAPADAVAGGLIGAPGGALARAMVRLPEVVEDAAAAQETQAITTYATELATPSTRSIATPAWSTPTNRSARRAARPGDAARITLANALGLLGISAPDSM